MKRREFLRTVGALSVLPPSLLAGGDGAMAKAGGTTQPTSQTLLLVDDYHILYRSGTKRVLHPLSRHAKNPLILGREKPWEVAIAWSSVYRNPVSGRYQLWYQSFAGDVAKEKTHRCTVCYAESSDGVVWTKPNLGLYSFNGIKETNIVLLASGGRSDRYGASVIVDPLEKDGARRYKMAYFDFAKDATGKETPGLNVAFSPDGIHWEKYSGGTLLPVAYGTVGQTIPYRGEVVPDWPRPLSMADAVDVFYDPKRNAFAWYGKMWIDGPDGKMFWKHAVGRTQSSDFIHWSRPELILSSDEHDPSYVEFHTTPVFFYNDCYFGCPEILNRAERGGIMDIELAISRDGLIWQRPFRRPFFLTRNSGNQFDSGSLFTNSTPVILDDEIHFYYGGYSQGATSGDDYAMTSGIGLASLPRDRFAGLSPMEKIAQVTFKPMDLQRCESLWINADANKGRVRCEVLDGDGYRLRGFTDDDAVPITGNSLRHAVRWKQATLSQLPKEPCLLRVHLENAEFFAVTLGNKA